MKIFYTSLRDHATNFINFEMKNNAWVNKKEQKLHQDATACYICRKIFFFELLKIKIIEK